MQVEWWYDSFQNCFFLFFVIRPRVSMLQLPSFLVFCLLICYEMCIFELLQN